MKQLQRLVASDLMSKSIEEMFGLEPNIFELEFEDGVIVTTRERTIWSWILWDVHRVFPETPLLMEHHIGNARITPTTHRDVLTRIKRSAKRVYDHDEPLTFKMGINDIIHASFNNLYNELTSRLHEYVAGANILDVLRVIKHPEIQAINENIKNNPAVTDIEIDKSYAAIEKILKNDPQFLENSVAIALNNGLVRGGQLLQCISARGYMPEIDGHIFKTPMLNSYSDGVDTLANYACESRMASISAMTQETTMRSLQYQNRSLQILNSDLRTIHYTDCGTTSYTTIVVDTMEKLEQYIGMYIIDEDGNWTMINHKNPDNLNRPLKFRTIADCVYPDRHGVCAKCFGELSSGVIPGDSVGQFVSALTQETQTQGGLSTKHYSKNAVDAKYVLAPEAKKYFALSKSRQTKIFVKPFLVDNNGYIVLAADEVENINNLDMDNSIDDISINRHTKITQVMVQYIDRTDNMVSEIIDIENGSKFSSLSSDALAYMLKHKWEIDENGNYKVSLKNWNVNLPFMQMPVKKADMVLAGKRFENYLKGISTKTMGDKLTPLTNFEDFGEALMYGQHITADFAPIKVSHLQVMLYDLMAADPEHGDYRLPEPTNRKSGRFIKFRKKVEEGNIATAMAYERQGKLLVRPSSFTNKLRSPSGFDYFVISSDKLNKNI